ncbi:MAG: PAS sensor protein [Bacteroidales bacterium]
MNEKAKKVFAKYGSLERHSLFECHSEKSSEKIRQMLTTGESNVYTIEKNSIRKIIIQLPWKTGDKTEGIMELSMELPSPLPHFIREWPGAMACS